MVQHLNLHIHIFLRNIDLHAKREIRTQDLNLHREHPYQLTYSPLKHKSVVVCQNPFSHTFLPKHFSTSRSLRRTVLQHVE